MGLDGAQGLCPKCEAKDAETARLHAAAAAPCSTSPPDCGTGDWIMRSTLDTAMADSIAHSCIARVDVDDLHTALVTLTSCVTDYNYATQNDGSLDVWGTDNNGNAFRVCLADAARNRPDDEQERHYQAWVKDWLSRADKEVDEDEL